MSGGESEGETGVPDEAGAPVQGDAADQASASNPGGRSEQAGSDDPSEPEFRSGFVTVVGRPNVGKSTLINRAVGYKVSIVSDKPQTTRHQIRGILNRPDGQLVFVDTPGLHRPRTALGERTNATAQETLSGVDLVCMLVEAHAKIGPGDRWIAKRLPPETILVVNKTDRAKPDQIIERLATALEFDFAEYFPVSAKSGEGVPELVEHLMSKLPPGPAWYATDSVSDAPEQFWIAELVREQLLARMDQELPHSIATRVTEYEWPRIRCEILVERDSQKGMVIGKGGRVLKDVGTAVREELPEGAFLELHVAVSKDWQRHADLVERLGY